MKFKQGKTGSDGIRRFCFVFSHRMFREGLSKVMFEPHLNDTKEALRRSAGEGKSRQRVHVKTLRMRTCWFGKQKGGHSG